MPCLELVIRITFIADTRPKLKMSICFVCLSIETSLSLTVANLIKQAGR